MLKSTFVHAPGVGAITERSLWQQGAHSWRHYLESAESFNVPARCKGTLSRTIEESLAALENGEVDYFARALPKREHWRGVVDFPKLGYLDIETDGGYEPDSVTIIGLYDGFETHLYTKGINLAQFAYECQDYDGFVTFFGGGFDLPFLKRRFPVLNSVFADRLHVDLCPLLKSLGYSGGLKSIERQLKINRRPETDGLSGMDAVRLWRIYSNGASGADEALHLLHAYNEEDVVNLHSLLTLALPRLQEKSGMPTSNSKVVESRQP